MTDTSSPHPLTDQALARLRKLAEGNGIAPDKIELIEGQEKVYELPAVSHLVPFCERHSTRYNGPPRGKDRKILADAAEMQEQSRLRYENFMTERDWLPAAMDELKAAPGQGWGLDGAKITLREKSVILAVIEICPMCHGNKLLTCENCLGQKVVACQQCRGQGQEFCPLCSGTGHKPGQPTQLCQMCNGRRTIPCRICGGGGKIPCPVCQGRGGLVCSRCNGAGNMTEETVIVCGVNINFRLNSAEMPSGLRRGLDRVGIANLAKGHADIKLIEPDNKETKDSEGGEDKSKTGPVVVRYETKLPYADLKMRFNDGRVVLVNVFGKRGVLIGVPVFLDDALKPRRGHLAQAAKGSRSLDDALKARLMRDALALDLDGKGEVANLRRLYPVGLSPAVAQEILTNMRRALNKVTRWSRVGAGAASGLAGAGMLAAFFDLPWHVALTQNWPWLAGLAFDLAALAGVMGLCWTGLGKVAQLILARRFPGRKISLHSNSGHIGYAMLAGIFAIWILVLMLVPDQPLWLAYLISVFNHSG